jgi:hypothetical protein
MAGDAPILRHMSTDSRLIPLGQPPARSIQRVLKPGEQSGLAVSVSVTRPPRVPNAATFLVPPAAQQPRPARLPPDPSRLLTRMQHVEAQIAELDRQIQHESGQLAAQVAELRQELHAVDRQLAQATGLKVGVDAEGNRTCRSVFDDMNTALDARPAKQKALRNQLPRSAQALFDALRATTAKSGARPKWIHREWEREEQQLLRSGVQPHDERYRQVSTRWRLLSRVPSGQALMSDLSKAMARIAMATGRGDAAARWADLRDYVRVEVTMREQAIEDLPDTQVAKAFRKDLEHESLALSDPRGAVGSLLHMIDRRERLAAAIERLESPSRPA